MKKPGTQRAIQGTSGFVMADFEKGNMISAMTRKEFSEKSEAVSRLQGVWALVALGVFFMGLFGVSLALNYCEKHLHASWPSGVFMLCLTIGVAGFMWSLIYLEKRLTSQFGLRCGHCGRSFAGSKLLTSTGNCPYCGEKILTDVASSEFGTSAGTFSRKEFVSKVGELGQKQIHRQVILLCVGFSVIIACFPLAKILDYFVERGSFSWAAKMPDWIIGITGTVFLATMLGIMIYAKVRKHKPPGVPCPHCQESLSGGNAQVAIATRSCPYCGEKIMD
jgi:DNA-directed RNA polymerase subunit RPC12/RpoP